MRFEWRYTYQSARRNGYSRAVAFRKFVREVLAGWRLSLGLHPKYNRKCQLREADRG
jgi:hypothetical protein